ncbi:MAG: hypothetical protein NTZ38_01600 [Candidatus Taylorbacteria bacterium]|nr:hypothetical protein [Candidatus Taylorbacteria bacterium]
MLSVFNIETVQIAGADPDIVPALRSVVYGEIDGDYGGLFSRSNIFLYPKASISKAVINASKRVSSVDIYRDGRTLMIEANEKIPVAMVCADLPDWGDNGRLDDKNTDKCFLVDDNGFLYARVSVIQGFSNISDNIHDRYFIPDLSDNGASSSEALIGTTLSTTTDFQALREFSQVARDHGIDIQAMLLRGNGEYEMYALNPASNFMSHQSTATSTVVIHVNRRNGFDNELANLISFWSNAVDKAKSGQAWPVWDYIDVRYGSNVFFRMVK